MATRKVDGHQVVIHEGPMADSRGTDWRDDAAKLEAIRQERIENPMQALPNNLTTIDKAHAFRGKGDGGVVDKTDNAVGGDHIKSSRGDHVQAGR